MSAFSKLLHEANTEGLSARRIAQEASKKGFPVVNTSISKYLRGAPESPSEHVLAALSAALLPAGQPELFVLPPEANRLTGKQRAVILHLIQVLLHESGPPGARTHRPGAAEAD